MGRYDKSIAVQEEARRYLAGGVSSNFRYHSHPVPLCIARGEGPYLWDVDGNRYLDYVLGNGPAILGHSPAPLLAAVRASLERGQAFTAVHAEEVALARRLTEVIPCAERVRFDVSGTQGDHIALRLARAFTGRSRVLKFEGQYHGWADDILASVRPAANEAGPANAPVPVAEGRGMTRGALDGLLVRSFNDLAALEETLAAEGGSLAAVILEPIACNTGVIEPEPGFLEGLRRLCDRHGIVLIFDEVVTGFRAAPGGAQQRYGVTPDLAVFAKAAGGGWPISIVAGRAEIMEEVTRGVVHGGTYNGLTASVAAAAATLEELTRDGGAALQALEARGRRLMQGLSALGRRHGLPLQVQGIGSIFTAVFSERPLRNYRDFKASDETLRQAFVAGLQDRGVRTTARGTWFLSTAHSEADIEETLEAADAVLQDLSRVAAE